MSTLSGARQVEFDFQLGDMGADNSASMQTSGPSRPRRTAGADVFDMPRFPSFTYAAASRQAGRVNAASIDPIEHRALLAERQTLVDKELAGALSPEETNRLEYVRWSLDRVDDAKYGSDFEQLADMVSQAERFHADINEFRGELEKL
ncbi:hypothetical protein ACVW1A_007107 [Bradyrhizobium sp. LB1.3]